MKNIFLSVLLLFGLFNAAYAYTVHIDAPAVLTNADRGVLTSIYLNVTSGNGTVSATTGGSGTVAQDTIQSAQTAVSYAASYLSINESRYDFSFRINSNDSNVSGPSAGLAMTLLSVAGLERTQLNPNFTVTGTINANGTVGQIGGVFDKVQAAKSINARYILVPYLNRSNYQYLFYYLSQQAYGVPVIEVRNVSQAVQYAIGNPQIQELNYTIYKNYYTSGLPYANATCSSCNESAFGQLMNFTFNFTQTQINNINGSKFGAIKSQLQTQLGQYYQIGSKGYRYSAADLAFNEYPTAFVFSNYNTANYYTALSTLNNITSYCNSVNSTPILTDTNYEYVFGGEARMQWSRITLSAAYAELNASQTSDDILLLLQTAAPAYSWCLATGQMYKIASSMGGNQISISQSAQQSSLTATQSIRKYGTNLLYVNASEQAYASGEYGAALYSADYANIFYNSTGPLRPNESTVSAAVSNALASPNGIWPQQFALQSEFYLYQASVANSSLVPGYLSDAYYTAKLSDRIGSTNAYLQSNFVAGATQPLNSSMSSQLSRLQGDVDLIVGALIIIIILLVAIILVLLIHLTRAQGSSEKAEPSVNITKASTRALPKRGR